MFVRTNEIERIVRLLTSGTCVDLVGARWSGRTEILRNVTRELTEQGYRVLLVRGIGHEPQFEALRMAIPAKFRTPATSRPGSFAAAVESLRSVVDGGHVVILIDDVDLLDKASWVALETVHKATAVPILAVSLVRSIDAENSRTLLRIAHPVIKLTLEAIKPDMTRAILEARLDGKVDAELSGSIHATASGLPGFVVAIADALRDAGVLRQRNDTWMADDELWSDELVGAYESLLFSYSRELREALETLAIVGVVDLETAVAVVGQETIEELESNSLVSLFTVSERTLVAVSPQGLATYFRHQPVSAKRLRLMADINRRLQISGSAGLDEAYAKWRATASVDSRPAGGSAPWEQPAVTRMLRDDLGIRSAILTAAWRTSPGPRTAADLWLSELCAPTSELDAIELFSAYLSDAGSASLDDADALALRYFHARSLVGQGASLPEIIRPLRPSKVVAPSVRNTFAIIELAFQMELAGIPSDYHDRLRALQTDDPLGREVLKVVLAMGHVFTSRGEEALRVLETVKPNGLRLLSVHVHYLEALALFASGRQLDALDLATRRLEQAISSIDSLSVVVHSYVAALSLTALGRFDDAWAIGELVSGLGVGSLPVLFSPDRALFMVQSVGAFNNGRGTAGEMFIEKAHELQNRTEALPLAGPRWDTAGTNYPAGTDTRRGGAYRKLAARLADDGYRLAGDVAAFMSLSSEYHDDYRREVEDAVVTTGGDLYRGYLRAQQGIHDNAPGLVFEGATILREAGASVAAARFFAISARLFRDQGDLDGARAARSLIREMEDAGAVQSPAISTGAAVEALSQREQEISALIAEGMSNAQIAARLALSTRTIESHINRIGRKTGAVGREDIGSLTRP